MTDIAQYLSSLSPMEKQTFSRFLKNKKAKPLFIRNFLMDDTTLYPWKYYISTNRPKALADLINLAFHWMDTNEGYTFWHNLDKEWRKMVTFHEY